MRLVRRLLLAVLAFAMAFSAVPASGASYLSSVKFADSAHGYLSGWYGNNPRAGFVSVSGDGGATWRAIMTGQSSPSGLAVMNASTAGAASPSDDLMLTTTDVGVSWTRTTPVVGAGASFSDIATSAIGYVAVGNRMGTSDGDVGIIYTSPDGVSGWTQRFSGPINPGSVDSISGDYTPGLPTFAKIDQIAFAPGGQVGWAIGSEWNDGTYNNTLQWRRTLLYRTDDGGSVWTTVTPAPTGLPQYGAHDLVAADSTHAYAVGPARYLLKTTNGATWAMGDTLKLPVAPATGYDLDAYGVDAIGTTVVAVGTTKGGAGIWWSTDAGVTWVNHLEPSIAEKLRSVQMLSATKWIVVGDEETIGRTNDGGLTWAFTRATAPTVAITSPAQPLTGVPTVVSGTSADVGAGVALVEVSVKRDDGLYWNGTAWVMSVVPVWNRTSTLNGWDQWTWNWAPDPVSTGTHLSVVTARATDAVGQTSPFTPSVGSVTRVAGTDRYTVAEGLARQGWDSAHNKTWPGVSDIIIANGEPGKEADPLSAAGLAGVYRAPVLLVQVTRIPAATKRVITEIAAKRKAEGKTLKVHIIGGTGSVPDARWNDIRAIPGVSLTKDRIAGADRYAVSANIANQIVRLKGAAAIKGIILIAGDDPAAFYDALAASPIAYATTMLTLSVRKTSVPLSVADVLKSPALAATPRFAASSSAYIGAGSLSGATRLTNSANRYTAASDIAVFALRPEHGWLTAAHTGLTAKLPDALTGGTFLGRQGGVMLLTDSTNAIQSPSASFIVAKKAQISRGWIIGGTGSVPTAQETSFANLLK